jgi:hypothetical protein
MDTIAYYRASSFILVFEKNNEIAGDEDSE